MLRILPCFSPSRPVSLVIASGRMWLSSVRGRLLSADESQPNPHIQLTIFNERVRRAKSAEVEIRTCEESQKRLYRPYQRTHHSQPVLHPIPPASRASIKSKSKATQLMNTTPPGSRGKGPVQTLWRPDDSASCWVEYESRVVALCARRFGFRYLSGVVMGA